MADPDLELMGERKELLAPLAFHPPIITIIFFYPKIRGGGGKHTRPLP